jgi:hypothetical protein
MPEQAQALAVRLGLPAVGEDAADNEGGDGDSDDGTPETPDRDQPS